MKLLGARIGVNTPGSLSIGLRQAGLTPLMAAAEKGRTEAVTHLVQSGADLDAADPQGWTALMHAIGNQRTEVMKMLLQAKASPTMVADEGVTPLHLAARGARPELVTTILAIPLPAAARE